jgi:hypothetical protein
VAESVGYRLVANSEYNPTFKVFGAKFYDFVLAVAKERSAAS